MSAWPRLAAFRGQGIQPGQEWLFPDRSSGHLCTKTVLRTIDRLAEEAGIRGHCEFTADKAHYLIQWTGR